MVGFDSPGPLQFISEQQRFNVAFDPKYYDDYKAAANGGYSNPNISYPDGYHTSWNKPIPAANQNQHQHYQGNQQSAPTIDYDELVDALLARILKLEAYVSYRPVPRYEDPHHFWGVSEGLRD
jgi:hypothetical protein